MRVQEKLDRFSSYIMNDVADKKRLIDTRVDEKLAKDYDIKELQFLEEAYEIIQKGLKSIDREKNELISKTLMDNKIKLLNTRNEIIHEVFEKAKESLRQYTKTDGYKQSLIETINKHKDYMGEGEYTIFLNYSDKDLYHDVQECFKEDKVFFEPKSEDIIGGCRLLNTVSNMYIDDTLAKRLEMEEENFLMHCGLDIEEEVGE
jgi:vacuolar-type H+-ATPase subunit E/Vma4